MKTISLRLDDDLAADLRALADIERTSQSDVMRAAISSYVVSRTSSQSFQDRLREYVEHSHDAYDRLRRPAV